MLKKLVAGVAMLSLMGVSAEACTVMIVTKGASEDGSVIVSHSNDGRGAEMNLVFVPAKDHPKDSMRPVYPTAVALDTMPEYNAYDQPNLVAPERSEDYDYPDRPHTRPIGFIPEVEHTYAYMDADYGIVNEHGLMFGECTDMSAHLPEVPYKEGGGIFYSSELSRVALERCKTAREAMDDIIVTVKEYKEMEEEEGRRFPEVQFDFRLDIGSFFDYYPIDVTAFAKYIGMNASVLRQYIASLRVPHEAQVKKIREGINKFASDLAHGLPLEQPTVQRLNKSF